MQQKILNNRYELEQKIGEGGMARVYRGRDMRLNRLVAVKVLHQHYGSDAHFLARFHHEAQAAANLRNPNIVDVYDVGQDGDIHYIVMEYVEGSDLKALILQRGMLPVEQAVSIARAVADGLDAAHNVGLIHRDIKPQNIIVGTNGRIKITDFGIAKSALSTSATETGVIFGTADYLSPEQARGQSATPRSDVYSLGITLYEMLTGRLPFTGDSAIAVAMQHITAEPVPPRVYNSRIPAQLEAIVLRALSKDPAQRPASAREFSRLLGNYLNAGEQETVVRPVMPRQGSAQPRPQPRNSANQQSRPIQPRTTLPPPRAATPPPADNRSIGFGGFFLGLLLIGGVLGLIAVFASGALNDIFSFVSTRPNTGGVVATAAPTAEEPTAEPTAGPTAVPQVVVPNIVGLDQSAANAAIQNARLVPRAVAQVNSDMVAAGLVAEQGLLAGSTITETSEMTYAVSLGPQVVQVEDVTGMRAATAQQVLGAQGLQVEQQTVSTDQVTAGFVVRQSPQAGLRVSPGDTVTIFVSDGNQTKVPDIYLKNEVQAQQLLTQAGLIGDFRCQGPESVGNYDQFAPGTVVSFEPSNGTTVQRGSTVIVGVRSPCSIATTP